jgi:hypothetical protein
MAVFIFSSISLYIFFVFTLSAENPRYKSYLFAFTLIYITFHFPLVLRLLFDLNVPIKFPSIAPLVIYLSTYILAATFFSAQSKISRIISSNRNPDVELISNSYEISTLNSSNRYIGKTKSYIFLYDLSNKATRVIPVNELKEFRIYSKP